MGKILQLLPNRKSATQLCSNCAKSGKELFLEFCDRTTIHGIKYLGDNHTSIPERIWWCVIILMSCCLCIKLIWNSYQKWEKYPIVTTFADSPTNIWEIPFPAVTICSEAKTQTNVFNYTSAFIKIEQNITLNEEEQRYYDYLSLICEHSVSNTSVFQNRQQVYENLLKIAPSSDLAHVNERYVWKDFTSITTNEGVCYTFNILDRNEMFYNPINGFGEVNRTSQWTIEDGYDDQIKHEDYFSDRAYPIRTRIAGSKGGITISMYTSEIDVDYACRGSLQGYKVVLHNPAEIPRMEDHFRVALDEQVTAIIQPKLIKSSATLKNYDPTVKKCFFQKDKPLRYYKMYTQQNCINECLLNFTESLCGCTEFYMPVSIDSPTPICGPNPYIRQCVNEVRDYLLSGKPFMTIEKFEDSCECLPSCTSLKYDVELSQTKYEWREQFSLLFTAKGVPLTAAKQWLEDHHSRLVLYMKEEQFMSLERHELYDSTDFLANCGGLLGLCMGVSIFSVLELIYFCTLKICCALKGKRKRECVETKPPEFVECKTIA